MNRIWAAAVIFLLLAGLCVLGFHNTITCTGDLLLSLSEIESNLKEGESVLAGRRAEELLEKWDDYHHSLSLYLPHARLESIDQALAALPPLIEEGNLQEFQIEYNRAALQIERLKDTEYPFLENIL